MSLFFEEKQFYKDLELHENIASKENNYNYREEISFESIEKKINEGKS